MKVRPLIESELGDADRIMRIAFGTFFGLHPARKAASMNLVDSLSYE